MSLGYAEKLSYREDLGGQLGDPEQFDSNKELKRKVELLADWVRSASNIVAFTGAGISTACGIPDFRGPNGVWTLQRAKKPLPALRTSFTVAKPSFTHQVLVALQQEQKLSYIVSQNVDGLHLRSGVPRASIAELHGNCFAERCSKCKKEYIRDFEIETVGFKLTGRKCTACGGHLRDHILDWEDALPDDELKQSQNQASQADLAICLGTSLQITPACNLPLRTVKAGGKLVIVNLQKTPKDKKADLVIHARVDDVMAALVTRLQLQVPPYVRQDTFIVGHKQDAAVVKPQGRQALPFSIFVASVHGPKSPLPMVDSVDVSFPEHAGLKPATLRAPRYTLKRSVVHPGPVPVHFRFNFVEAADEDKRTASAAYIAHLRSPAHTDACRAAGDMKEADDGAQNASTSQKSQQEQQVVCMTQRLDYNHQPLLGGTAEFASKVESPAGACMQVHNTCTAAHETDRKRQRREL